MTEEEARQQAETHLAGIEAVFGAYPPAARADLLIVYTRRYLAATTGPRLLGLPIVAIDDFPEIGREP
jgi:hypothetical protein